MKLTKLSLCLATLALGIASAASNYTVKLSSNISAGDTQLKSGEYKLEVADNQVIFKQGKKSIPIPATVEKNASNYRYTSVETENSKLQAIDLGGTNMKIVFTPAASAGTSTSAQ